MTETAISKWTGLITDFSNRLELAESELGDIAKARSAIALAIVSADPTALKTAAGLDKRKREKAVEIADLEAAIVQARAELRKAEDLAAVDARIARAGLLESLAYRHAQACGSVDKAMKVLAVELSSLFSTERDLNGAGVATKRIAGALIRALWFAFSKASDKHHGTEREVLSLLGHDRPSPESWAPISTSARSGKAALSLAKALRSGNDPETLSGNALEAA